MINKLFFACPRNNIGRRYKEDVEEKKKKKKDEN